MKNWFKNNFLKIIAILFLLGALGDWEYGYYQFLRWTVFAIGAYSAYLVVSKGRKEVWVWIFGAIAVLFNPILPIYLSKSTWQILDVIVAGIFLISLIATKKSKKPEQ